jgi:hypothetical protein
MLSETGLRSQVVTIYFFIKLTLCSLLAVAEKNVAMKSVLRGLTELLNFFC